MVTFSNLTLSEPTFIVHYVSFEKDTMFSTTWSTGLVIFNVWKEKMMLPIKA